MYLFMLSNLGNNAMSLQKIVCRELIISMTFNYNVCNICGTMAHSPVTISEESIKI